MTALAIAAAIVLTAAAVPGQAGRSMTPGAPPEQKVLEPPGPIQHDCPGPPDEARAVLSALFEASGLSVDPEEQGEGGEIVTGYLRFSPEDFGQNVAMPPPRLSPVFPYMQPQHMTTGEYRLRARVEPHEGFSRIFLLAELRTTAFNSFTHEHDELVRFSDGTIEKAMYARFDALLEARQRAQRESVIPPE